MASQIHMMSSVRNLFLNSKIFRVIIQIFLWIMIFLFPLHHYNVRIEDPKFYKREIIDDLFFVGLFYFNLSFLIPKYFAPKKRGKYFLLVGITIVFIIFQQFITQKIFEPPLFIKGTNNVMYFNGRPVDSGFRPTSRPRITRYSMPPPGGRFHRMDPDNLMANQSFIWGMPSFMVVMVIRKSLTTSLLLLLLGSFLKLSTAWSDSEVQLEKLSKEKLDAELKLLKAQVNPHFLFNTLNSLYVLAHKKSEYAPEAILKLSNIMRYMIYDTMEDVVPLEKELEYIENYIALQRLRLPDIVKIDYQVVQNGSQPHFIEPMLLLPFIENTFKHGVSYKNPCEIEIKIYSDDQSLVVNTLNPLVKKDKDYQGGMGLVNIKKRLALLYGNNYKLDILEQNNQFMIRLELQFNQHNIN